MKKEMTNEEIIITLNKLADDYRVYPDETKALEYAIQDEELIDKILKACEEGRKVDVYIRGRLFEIRELAQ